jgi:protein tyrosine phosphatase
MINPDDQYIFIVSFAEHNSTIIVMLTKLKEMGKEKCTQYWPDTRSVRYQYYVVDPVAEYNMPQYKLREFKVTDARDGSSRTVRQFQFQDWPEQGKNLFHIYHVFEVFHQSVTDLNLKFTESIYLSRLFSI